MPRPSHTAAVVYRTCPWPGCVVPEGVWLTGPLGTVPLVSGTDFLFLKGLRPAPYRAGTPGRRSRWPAVMVQV